MIFGKIFGLLGLVVLISLPAWAQESLEESTDLAETGDQVNEEDTLDSLENDLEDQEGRRKYYVWRWKLLSKSSRYSKRIVVCRRVSSRVHRHFHVHHHHHHHHHLAEDNDEADDQEAGQDEVDSENEWRYYGLVCSWRTQYFPYRRYYWRRYRSYYWA